jgi:hypothetical protein
MNKKKLARAIGICTMAIMIIIAITIFPSCGSAPTPPTYGLEFDGIDDYVSLGNATALGFTSQDFTIEAWIKPGNVTKGMQIFQRHGWNANGYRLNMASSGRLQCSTFQSGAGQTSQSSAGIFIAGNWSHVAAVRDGASVRLWVNGVDSTNITGSHIDPAYAANMTARIGTYLPGVDAFQGCISEVRIWNYARSESQIKADMSGTLTGAEEGLIGYWKLNEGSGTIAHDSTPNSNNGTLVGDPVWFTGGG